LNPSLLHSRPDTLALPSQPESGGRLPPAPPPPPSPPPPTRWTVLEVLRWTTSRFSQRGLASPRLDAEILAAHALGVSRVQLYVQFDRPLEATELGALRALVKRRQAGESVAYIIGKKEFFGIELAVDARVLVPRPDTETLVDEALARLTALGEHDTPARIVDVGTGSGAVVIAIAKTVARSTDKTTKPAKIARTEAPPETTPAETATAETATAETATTETTAPLPRPAPQLFASDLSSDALALARDNAQHHGVTVTFLEGDLAEPLRAHAPFDVIVANLPYIPSADIAGLAPEVRAEPRRALDGGDDGLALVRRLVSDAPALLRAGGALALEIGAGQAAATAALLTAAGFIDVRLRRDLGEIERVVSGVKA
jgi:release factor glutamine methyltransferase